MHEDKNDQSQDVAIDPARTQEREMDFKVLGLQALQNEARVQALLLGADPDKLPYVLRMAELPALEDDVLCSPPVEPIREAVAQVLDQIPELKLQRERPVSGGINPQGSGALSKGEAYRERIREAKRKRDWQGAIALKLEAAAEGIIIT